MKITGKITPITWILAASVFVAFCSSDKGKAKVDPEKMVVQPPRVDEDSPPQSPWRLAGGNMYIGSELYFGEHDRIYRGRIVDFIDTPKGEVVVVAKKGKVEMIPRRTIVLMDFWVKVEEP